MNVGKAAYCTLFKYLLVNVAEGSENSCPSIGFDSELTPQ